jgi:hypothetical protein
MALGCFSARGQVVQLRLALNRRCPSILANAGEFDEDLVRLCEVSRRCP